MILVTVGAQMPFDRLIAAVDHWAEVSGCTDIFAQIGDTEFRPKHLRWTQFVNPDQFRELVESADLVVAHAGMGSVLTALELGKPIIVMPHSFVSWIVAGLGEVSVITTDTPMWADFCSISELMRPVVSMMEGLSMGSLSRIKPANLSRVLCLPMSSAITGISLPSEIAEQWMPREVVWSCCDWRKSASNLVTVSALKETSFRFGLSVCSRRCAVCPPPQPVVLIQVVGLLMGETVSTSTKSAVSQTCTRVISSADLISLSLNRKPTASSAIIAGVQSISIHGLPLTIKVTACSRGT